MQEINILFKEPGKEAVELKIKNKLTEYSKLIDGPLELVSLSYFNSFFETYGCITKRRIIALVDEEGLLKDKKENIALDKQCQTVLIGNIVFGVREFNSDEITSLNKSEIQLLKSFCHNYTVIKVPAEEKPKQKELER